MKKRQDNHSSENLLNLTKCCSCKNKKTERDIFPWFTNPARCSICMIAISHNESIGLSQILNVFIVHIEPVLNRNKARCSSVQ